MCGVIDGGMSIFAYSASGAEAALSCCVVGGWKELRVNELGAFDWRMNENGVEGV